MKKISLLFVITSIVLIACKKYPDGPAISLRSKTERLSNSWQMAQVLEGGVDKTSDYQFAFNGYNLIIENDGNYSYNYKALGVVPISETGKWAFNSDKTKVIFDPSSNNNGNNELKILRLMEEDLWLLDEDNNGAVTEFHFSPK